MHGATPKQSQPTHTTTIFVTRVLLALSILILFASPALAWETTVISVHDGDSITVKRKSDGERVKIRLSYIDAPEMPVKGRWQAQPYCQTVTRFLA